MGVDDPEPGGRPANEAIVRLIDLHKHFDLLHVLKGISIDFHRGKTTVVLGPSGCGKSVMLKHVIGLLRPDSGQVWFRNERVDTLAEGQLGAIRRRFGFLFQQSALFDSISVEKNVAFPLVEHSRMSPRARQARVDRVLDMVGLTDTPSKMPAELSGGQRKRIALARAIVLEPEVILYDEPTTGLDPIRADVINELILKLQRDLEVTSIVVTHDLTSAFKVADEILMLYDGRVIMRGTPEEFRRSDVPLVQWFLRGDASGGGESAPKVSPHGDPAATADVDGSPA
jgi:phospholipid/cholesterol/gamma-HCH transport system ATP-binding protein